MSRDVDEPRLLLGQSRSTAERLLEQRMPVTWSGHQLVALVRHWGYAGHDYRMPPSFERFDHVMMDLECFPDGGMSSDEQIVSAAREVLADAQAHPPPLT
jgi:hypothetical protein